MPTKNNWRNKYGESWIKCLHAFHSGLSPTEEVWPFDKFCRYGEEVLINDLFRTGYVDMAILNSTYLYEFYRPKQRHQGQIPGPLSIVRLLRPAGRGGGSRCVSSDGGGL